MESLGLLCLPSQLALLQMLRKIVLLMKVVCKETGELLGSFASVSRVGEKTGLQFVGY